MNKISFPLEQDMRGPEVGNLQDALQAFLDRVAILRDDPGARKEISARLKDERKEQIYARITGNLVQLFQKEYEVKVTGSVDKETAAAMNALLRKLELLDQAEPAPAERRIEGRIMLDCGLPADGLTLRLYQRGFGDKKKLLKETRTDKEGGYAISYSVEGAANIEIYAVGADEREVQLSRTKSGAAALERIDLIAPSSVQPPPAEFTRLKASVSQHTDGKPEILKDAVERGNRRDFTNIANATGWDAAALALASEAFDAAERTKIPAEGLYALVRAGLPADTRRLAGVSKQTVDSVLRRAAEAGVVDTATVEKSVQAFIEFASEHRVANIIRGALSSPKEFIEKAHDISDADRAAFTKVIREENTADIWGRAKAAGVTEDGIQKFQVQGKLAYLTFNNAELVDYLVQVKKVTSKLLVLIDLGFYDKPTWEKSLWKLAGGNADKLGSLIPPVFSGRSIEERLGVYAEELARRVRQMDTHAVTVDRIATGKIGGVSEREGVSKFLKNAAALGFRMGKTPLSSFVSKNEAAVWDGIPSDKKELVLGSICTLSSLYATSPSDEALNALLLAGFGSGTAIAKNDYIDFEKRIKPFLPPGPQGGDQEIIQKIFWKAQQQSATVFNVFDGLKRLNSILPAPGSTPNDVEPRNDQIKRTRDKLKGLFPTLETLFGSVDYCECNHCQSVLSPAAYLVDLLHFIDPNNEAWATVKALYKEKMGVDYTGLKPFDALNNRRPDIKNIALTCENTNTALPYIDIVNEILEQVMMSDATPAVIEVYDVGETSSQDLIAEPQNILWKAYVGTSEKSLRERVYPVTLPFDLPLEMARAFLKQLDLPLWRLRECLAQPGTLDPTSAGRTDGWTDVWFERLGLGAGDVSALTRSTEWYKLFGYASAEDALWMVTTAGVTTPDEASLRNAKTLARRLDITYKELVELVRTRFINPDIENLIALKRLGIDPEMLDRYLEVSTPLMTATEKGIFEAHILAQGVSKADLAPLRTETILQTTLVLRSPGVGCDFSKTTVAFAKEPASAGLAFALVLSKMNAFVRLQKKLGWEIHELDRMLMAVMPGGAAVTMGAWPAAMKSALVYLAHVEELKERFQNRLSREEIAVFWSDISAKGISCLYERLFLYPGIPGRDATFDKRLGNVFAGSTTSLDLHTDAIRQAFQLVHDDIEPILKAGNATDRILSIKNLSILMRHAALAKGLGLTITELLTLMSLSERKPLSSIDASPLIDLVKDVPWCETLAFVREVELLGEAGVDGKFLERICRHRGVAELPAENEDPVSIALKALPPVGTTTAKNWQTLVTQTLSTHLSTPEVVIELLLGSVLKDSANKLLKEEGFSDATRTAESLRKVRRALDLVQTLGITIGELHYLTLASGALSPNDLPVNEVASDATAQGLRKGLTIWLEMAAARRLFGRSERLLAVMSAAEQPTDLTNTHTVRETQLHEAMAALTGLKASALKISLEAIGAKSAGGASFEVAALAQPAKLCKVIESLKCFTRIGLNPADVVQFAALSIDDSVAQRLRSSLKGRYTASAWRSLVKPIFDGLRKKQRDALVAHLTHVMNVSSPTPKYGDTAEKLFEYLLLDPGMEPVVIASRIQLAIASVQLFVQRCLMNLETGVDPQIIDVKRWEWMSRYRVWEVNRKMFIWPENWLDPEFRDDKTHLFRDLAGKLLQGDVNDDLVRNCLNSYLKGLEEIARLEMLTMYFEPGASADGSVIHVVGRTMNAPHKYFYRKSSHGMWTPWEPIDVGIEGEHLVLTSWRGRMHLFWVSFLEQARESSSIPLTFKPGTDEITTSNLRGTTQVKLQLHWVEQVQGKWGSRSSTPGFVDTNFAGEKATSDDEKRAFFVRAVLVENEAGVEDDDLEIHVTKGDNMHKFVLFSKLAAPRSVKEGVMPVAPPFKLVDDAALQVQATKWQGEDALQVKFVSAVTQSSEKKTVQSGTGYHTVLNGVGGFSLLFPSNEQLPVPAQTPPTGVGRPIGYVFRPQNTHHVAYRSGDGSIYDLFWTKNGWFYQSPSVDAEKSNGAEDAEPAVSDPHGYTLDDRGTICLAYSGKTKIHELVWSQLDTALDDETKLDTGWKIDTLYEGLKPEERPTGRPFGGLYLPDRGVVFRTADGRLLAAVEGPSGASWQIQKINEKLPKAVSDPTGLLMTKIEHGVTSVVSRHIIYFGDDNNIYELKSDLRGKNWAVTNISKVIADIVDPAQGSTPAAYAFLAQKTLHIVYRGKDERIHELWRATSGSWNYSPMDKGFTQAKGEPFGYVSESASTQHVVYRGQGDEVVELWNNEGKWQEKILTKSMKQTSKALSDVAGYSFESLRTRHNVYFAEDGSLKELRGDGEGWHTGTYKLSNPFPDDLGPLASPFFYEASRKDHTFFVEPYVIETAVHEWTEWIVTTKEYEEFPVLELELIPLIPFLTMTIPFVQSFDSVIKNKPDRYSEKIFGEGVAVRTSKGIIVPKGDVKKSVDVRSGQPLQAKTESIKTNRFGGIV